MIHARKIQNLMIDEGSNSKSTEEKINTPPKLIYCTGIRQFILPKGPEAYRRSKEVRGFYGHKLNVVWGSVGFVTLMIDGWLGQQSMASAFLQTPTTRTTHWSALSLYGSVSRPAWSRAKQPSTRRKKSSVF